MLPLMTPWHLSCSADHLEVIYYQRAYVVPQFDHLDLRNVVLSLMIPLTSCDIDAGGSGIT